MTCKGTCTKYRARRVGPNRARYASDLKYCSIYECRIEWPGRYCPCCNYTLRTGRRATTPLTKRLRDLEMRRI